MKKLVLLLPVLVLILGSCEDKCSEVYSHSVYTPVFASKDEVLKSSIEGASEINSPERLYFKDNYVFIVESGEGIHVINNTNPATPINESFIRIPGNHDVSIQDNYLYADNYTDLLVFDVSDIQNISEVNRVPFAFEYVGTDFMINHEDPSLVIVDYEETIVESEYEFDCGGTEDDVVALFAEGGDVTSSGSGVGGSTSRFTINNGFLFAVDYFSIRPFDLQDPSLPEINEPTHIGWDIETVFPYNDQLFIGSQSGMHIYDVSNPSTPEFLSVFEHANACDPVVVQDDIAFVTLRDGTECQTFINQLDIIDVSDLTNPQLIKTYPMDNPHGLGVQGNCLYICEGAFGLKHFNIEDVNNLTLENHFNNIHALDVVPLENNLLLIGEDGFHQYGGLCTEEIFFLSTLAFK